MRWLARLAILTLLVSASAAGGERHRASPVRITGKVVDVLTGAPLAGAKVRVKGLFTVSTNSRGRFRSTVKAHDSAEAYGAVIKKRGYWTYRPWLILEPGEGSKKAIFGVIPKSSAFDMEFFDTVVRGIGGTTRWLVEPVFELLQNRIECTAGSPGSECASWTVASEPMSADRRALIEAFVVQEVAAATGGFATPATISVRTLAPGTVLTKDDLLEDGKFVFAEHIGTVPAVPFVEVENGTPIGSQVYVLAAGNSGETHWLIRRNILRSLGFAGFPSFNQCAAFATRGLLTGLCEDHGVVVGAADAAHAMVLYARPPGNQRPDQDPVP